MEESNILSLKNITKQYPGVKALDDISIDIRRGEVHALVGENGAGKSTLIKTISGAIRPDSGEIVIDGQSYRSLTPTESRKAGVAIIYQEFTLVPVMSAAENIFMGEFIQKGWVCDQKKMNEMTRQLFERLKVHIDPEIPVEQLTTGYQQIVEIAKAVSKNAKILIMDEPSAPLSNTEVEAMFDIVRMLKQAGTTIIYISHRLEEIFTISDRVTVLRDGKYIGTKKTAETNKDELIRMMVGRELSETYPARPGGNDTAILSLRHLTGNGVENVSFDVKEGEILGLVGLMGAVLTELSVLLFGNRPIQSGEVRFMGKPLTIRSPMDAIDSGICLIPEDRKLLGLVLPMCVRENISMSLLKRISTAGVVNSSKEGSVVKQYMSELRIKATGPEQLVKNLSGGNQQKVVLSKWLAMDPKVLILDEPTRGIDVGAKQEIYKIMVDLVRKGKTIIMISSDMEELIGMSDRMVILYEGKVTGILEKDEFSQERILKKSEGSDYDE